jgi:hypothetical protein
LAMGMCRWEGMFRHFHGGWGFRRARRYVVGGVFSGGSSNGLEVYAVVFEALKTNMKGI